MIATASRSYPFYKYGEPDGYGQETLPKEPSGVVKMAVYVLAQEAADNIRYRDAKYIGLTNSGELSEKCQVDYNGVRLKVRYVQPQGRVKQVYMSEV